MLARPPLPLGGFASSSIHSTSVASAKGIVSKYRQGTALGRHVSRLSTFTSTCPAVKRRSKPLCPLPFMSASMINLTNRRPHTTSSKGKGKEPERRTDHDHGEHEHEHDHAHEHNHDHHEGHTHAHSHSHSQSVFGSFGHTHSHAEGGHGDAEKVIEALKGSGASSSRVNLRTR